MQSAVGRADRWPPMVSPHPISRRDRPLCLSSYPAGETGYTKMRNGEQTFRRDHACLKRLVLQHRLLPLMRWLRLCLRRAATDFFSTAKKRELYTKWPRSFSISRHNALDAHAFIQKISKLTTLYIFPLKKKKYSTTPQAVKVSDTQTDQQTSKHHLIPFLPLYHNIFYTFSYYHTDTIHFVPPFAPPVS